MMIQYAPAIVSAHPARVDIDVGEVHVWTVILDEYRGQLAELRSLLSPTELTRAGRLRTAAAGDHLVIRRGLLRVILAPYLCRAPRDVSFHYGDYGKPELAPGAGDRSVTFNVSVSHGVALYAVTRGRAVGVDVERMRDGMAHAGLAERYFSAAERTELGRLPAGDVAAAFFAGWTRKEAYVKALGTGLRTRLDGFAVSLAPGVPARLLAPSPGDVRRWTLAGLDTVPGWAAALAVAGDCERIVNRPWPAGQAFAMGAV